MSFNCLTRSASGALLALALLLPAADIASAAGDADSTDAPRAPQRLVLAVDGVPHDLFAKMQARGLFAGFRPVARMVSTFPSLSDVSFSAIGGNPRPQGYQVMRFDAATNQVVGNTLMSLSGKAHSNLPADSADHSSVHRMIGYLASYHMSLHDLRQIRRQLLASDKTTFLAYLEGSDAVLHVEGERGATRLLVQLDRYLAQLQAEVRARTGRELLIDLVSDHGSTLRKGRNVDLGAQLRSCGLQRSPRIDRPDQVAYSLAGIIGSVAINAQPAAVATVAHCLAGTDGVELTLFDRGDRITVLSADGGEADVSPAPGSTEKSYVYAVRRGDPLRLLHGQVTPVTRTFAEAALFQDTLDAHFPDPLQRIWRAFHGAVQEPTPILLSLADGREAGFRSVRALAQLRGRAGTHGSLTRSASLGILTSNWRDVSDVDSWQAHESLFGAQTLTAMQQRTLRWQRLGQADSARIQGSGVGNLHPHGRVVARPVP